MECHPVHQKVVSSKPSQGTCPRCEFSPWLKRVLAATDRCFSLINVSLSLYLSLPPSLSSFLLLSLCSSLSLPSHPTLSPPLSLKSTNIFSGKDFKKGINMNTGNNPQFSLRIVILIVLHDETGRAESPKYAAHLLVTLPALLS